MKKTSALPGFYSLPLEERLSLVKAFAGLSEKGAALLKKTGSLDLERAGVMSENVIGTFELPFGVATNFIINGKDYLIPMVIEEPSVVAAASHGAKLCLPLGFHASADRSVMKSMIQLVGVPEIPAALQSIEKNKKKLLALCHDPQSSLVQMGGGVFDIAARTLETSRGTMVIVEVFCDCKDAMGANTVNTAAEKLAPLLEELTGGRRRLMILSNLADLRLARALAVWKKETIGEDVIEGILDAYAFAAADIYRCATHNKGIMNGIDAVCVATGNDFRALEAGAHAFASRSGRYSSLTHYEKNENGDLVGRIELPLAVGIVGGSTKTNPLAQVALNIIGATSSQELACAMAAVGLAQNFASLRAQVAEGIQKGHMKLHAKNLAVMAGANEMEIDAVVDLLLSQKNVTASEAQKILAALRQRNK